MPKASRLGDIFKHGPIVTGALITGSPNVFINSRPAATTIISVGPCAKEKGLPMPVATGSSTVVINNQKAARIGDKLICGAKLTTGSSDVIIGD